MSVDIARRLLAESANAAMKGLVHTTDADKHRLAETVDKQAAQIADLHAAIRETIPVLDRAGRAVLATKLRKLIGG